jgi:hypothetical protein
MPRVTPPTHFGQVHTLDSRPAQWETESADNVAPRGHLDHPRVITTC